MAWTISSECAIDAPASRVWAILVSPADYARWNPFILELRGTLDPGARIRFRFRMLGLRVWATATVLVVDEDRELRWTGHLLFDWLFRAEHFHILDARGESAVHLQHGETFSGLLLPVVRLLLRRSGPETYRAFNVALKARAEAGD